MSTATLTTAPDVERAVTDDAYYAEMRAALTGPDLTAFERAVDTAYTNRHPARPGLTAEDHAILAFASKQHGHRPRAAEQDIRAALALSATVYYQRLGWLIDNPAAAAAYPVLVNRLRRIRDTNRTRRTATRPAERTAR